MSYHQPVQQAPYDPEIIYIVNSPIFKDWHQYHSQFFHFESVYEAAVVFILEGLPDVVSQLTSGLHSITGLSNAAASSSQPNAPTWTYPQYDGPVPILGSQGTPAERWESLKNQLFNTSGVEEGKNYAGQSILTDWLEQFPDRRFWTCQVPIEGSGGRPCGAGFSRVDRAIVHIRGKHLEMRPYSCDNGGNCQMPNCTMAFTSKENRAEHWNPKKITCTQWFVVAPRLAMDVLLMNATVVKLRCAKTWHVMYNGVPDAEHRPRKYFSLMPLRATAVRLDYP